MSTEAPQQRFDRWLKEHRGLMLKIAFSFTSNVSDQEDLLQEIAIALWKSIQGFRAESKESTWVYKVALFTATTWSRGEMRRKVQPEVTETEHLSNERAQPLNERQEWLLDSIRTLPINDRTLLLSSLQGYSHEEIAKLLGMSTVNVGVRLHRLKKQLSALATEHFNDI